MKTESLRYIIGTAPISLEEIPGANEMRRTHSLRKEKTEAQPSIPVPSAPGKPKVVHGYVIQKVEIENAAIIFTEVLGALEINEGFLIKEKEHASVRDLLGRHNRDARKIWGQDRHFELKKGINMKNKKAKGVCRVLRIK